MLIFRYQNLFDDYVKNKNKKFFEYICSFNYGWKDKLGNIHARIDKSYYDTFILKE